MNTRKGGSEKTFPGKDQHGPDLKKVRKDYVFLPEAMCCLGLYFGSFWVNWAIALPAIKAYLLWDFCTLSGSLDCHLDVFPFCCYIPIIQPIMYTTRCEETWLPGALQVFPVVVDAVEILDL